MRVKKEYMDAIEDVVKLLAPSFVFGYYDVEDIKQEGRIFGLLALKSYDDTRPISNYLYTSIKNRLIGFKRDNFSRTDPPCVKCHEGISHNEDDELCESYVKWVKRNNTKAGLMRPFGLDEILEDNEPSQPQLENLSYNGMVAQELLDRINEALPADMRSNFLKALAGEKITNANSKKLRELVKEILKNDKDNNFGV